MNFHHFLTNHLFAPYVRRASYGIRKEDRHTRDRRLLEYHLTLIEKGHCVLYVEGEAYRMKQGDFFLLQPGWLNRMESQGDLLFPFVAMDLFYHVEREKGVILTQGMTDLTPYRHLLQPRLNDIPGVHIPVKLEPTHPGRLRDLLQKTISAWNRHDVYNQLEADHLAEEMMLMLLRQYVEPHERTDNPMQSLNWVPRYMQMFLKEPLTVEELAKMADLSPSHFSAVFRHKFSVPPHRYLLQRRIELAATLLGESQLTTDEIAEECGFTDVQHLYKMFKKYKGLTPGDYRKLSEIRENI